MINNNEQERWAQIDTAARVAINRLRGKKDYITLRDKDTGEVRKIQLKSYGQDGDCKSFCVKPNSNETNS